MRVKLAWLSTVRASSTPPSESSTRQHFTEACWTGKKLLRFAICTADCHSFSISLKQEFPDLIVGFDLVGWEDPPAGSSLKDYLPELLWFKKYTTESKLDIPFIFHAGETISDGGAADENVSWILRTEYAYSLIF